jgi:hypothetical protein
MARFAKAVTRGEIKRSLIFVLAVNPLLHPSQVMFHISQPSGQIADFENCLLGKDFERNS